MNTQTAVAGCLRETRITRTIEMDGLQCIVVFYTDITIPARNVARVQTIPLNNLHATTHASRTSLQQLANNPHLLLITRRIDKHIRSWYHSCSAQTMALTPSLTNHLLRIGGR